MITPFVAPECGKCKNRYSCTFERFTYEFVHTKFGIKILDYSETMFKRYLRDLAGNIVFTMPEFPNNHSRSTTMRAAECDIASVSVQGSGYVLFGDLKLLCGLYKNKKLWKEQRK